MSVSDAAPLPRQGEVFFDVRGNSRSMRLSWYADTGVAVFSIWQAGMCTGTFRLPMADLSRMVETLERGPTPQGRRRPPVTAARQPADRDENEYSAPAEDEIGGLDSPARPAAHAAPDAGSSGRADEYGPAGYDVPGYDAPGYGPGAAAGDSRTAEYAPADYRSKAHRASDHGTPEYGPRDYSASDYGASDYGASDYGASDYGAAGPAAGAYRPDGYGPATEGYHAAGYGPDREAVAYRSPTGYEPSGYGHGDNGAWRDPADHEPDGYAGRDYGQSDYRRADEAEDDGPAWQRWYERPEYGPADYERRAEPSRDDLGGGYESQRESPAGSHRRGDAGYAPERGGHAFPDTDASGYREERFVAPYVRGRPEPDPNDDRGPAGSYDRGPGDPAYRADRRSDSAAGRYLDPAEPEETYSYGAEYRYR